MAGGTLMSFLRAQGSGLDYQNVLGLGDTKHLPSNWNLKDKYVLHEEEDECGCLKQHSL